jgi:DNA processing protein
VDAVGEVRALLILDQLPGVGLVKLRRLVERFGSASAALAASNTAFAAVVGRRAAAERAEVARARAVDDALDTASRLDIRVVSWEGPEYPRALWHLPDPPPVLFLRGRGELLGCTGVTVVGARRATGRARDLAERLGAALGRAGVAAVSGMALGVDGAVHRGALEAGGATVAVLGTGADVTYPRAHRRLLGQVVERGLVVSEFLPGTPALAHHFPRRNRILAALSPITVVVEAGARSGALITVDHALDLGREVWVVPGPIEQATSAGSNLLLLEGARPLLSIGDFVSAVAPDATPGQARLDVTTGPEAEAIRALAGGALGIDDMAARLDLTVPEALALLTELEVRGTVRRMPGMRFGLAA